jgi:transposase InsO family protein
MAERVVAMDVRLAVLAFEAVDEGELTVSAVCRRLGISRDTFYRYRRQVAAEGIAGVLSRSSRPRSSPNQTGAAMTALIVAMRARLREQGWDEGARSIRARLLRAGHPGVPSARTVHRVLVRAGLVEPEPHKRPRSSYRRFEHPDPNACWQLDGTGWPLADGRLVWILRLVDDHSRLILATRAARGETTVEALALLHTAIRRHGRPVLLLSDGGAAFTNRRIRGGINVFERTLRDLGITPVVSSPRHPQTCGKKERDWQPLKKWLAAQRPAATLDGLQRLLDAYDVLFNTDRPHQGIHGATPAERYRARPKVAPEPGPRPAPVAIFDRTGGHAGQVELGEGYRLNLGHQWTGARLTVIRADEEVIVLHGTQTLRRLTIDRTRRLQPSGLPAGRPPKRRVLSDRS